MFLPEIIHAMQRNKKPLPEKVEEVLPLEELSPPEEVKTEEEIKTEEVEKALTAKKMKQVSQPGRRGKALTKCKN